MSFPKPANEPDRLAALRALDILDSAPEIAYDEIAELAAQICGCPVAYISFIDDDRRWLKARYGLSPEMIEAPRANAVCTTTICGAEVFVVPDMKQDPRFENNPLVVGGPRCRFYCGMPLITDEGYALGTLCVMDFEPRQLPQIDRPPQPPGGRLSLRRSTRTRASPRCCSSSPTRSARRPTKTAAANTRGNAALRSRRLSLPEGSLPAEHHPASERSEPAALVGLLDRYFTAFDDVSARYGLEKVKTIGDAYMAVAGTLTNDRRHPIDVCMAALEMQARVERIKAQSEKIRLPALELRVGIHTGPVISGIVGNRRFTFDIWGDAVNTAWFMEARGVPGRINVSETVAGHVRALFDLERRGAIEAKHERAHEMFFLNRLQPEFSRDPEGRMPNQNFTAEYNRLLTGFSG